MKFLVIAILALGIQACSHDDSSSTSSGGGGGGDMANNPQVKAAEEKCTNTPQNPGTDIRYVINKNSNSAICTTGCQIFTSMQAYCSGLKDDQLNNNCAKDDRDAAFVDAGCN